MTTNFNDVSNLENDKKRNNRSVYYKKPIKKDNQGFDIENHDEAAQEIRRQRLLQHQKEKRDAAFNSVRGILEEVFLSEEENEEPMEVQQPKNYSKKKKFYKNKLMMSEWMFDVPEDFSEKWYMVPCPKGRRNLLVACKGRTRVYSRRGEKLAEFYSALPGGNPSEQNRNCTILDCIWVTKEQAYYVLDVLAWSTQPLLHCDAEFRRFWLKSKLEETDELKLKNVRNNKHAILPLPSIFCDDNLPDFLQNLHSLPPLDGFLFYHREGEYMHTMTPLVTWLKPFMLSEVLGISVPSPMNEKPDGYIDYRHHILAGRDKKSENAENALLEQHMDISSTDK